jgi:membrane protease subunit HflC
MTRRVVAVALIAAGLVVVAMSAFYTVAETEQVVITQFGEPIGKPITRPGLHWKTPFVQEARYFDKRWLEWLGDANQVPTRDKKYIWVETYARWRIADPLRFYQRLRDEIGAQSRIDDIIDGETRNVIANHDLIEVVRSSNREFAVTDDVEDVKEEEVVQRVDLGREKLTRMILDRASRVMPDYGIELVDVRIHRVNYVQAVRARVYERMVSERKRIAARHRSEGQGESAKVRGKKEREIKSIESEAYRKAQETMGRSDAEAAAIYAAAYGRDPEFYRFVRSMDTYRSTLDPSTWLVLSTDSDLLKYLRSAGR